MVVSTVHGLVRSGAPQSRLTGERSDAGSECERLMARAEAARNAVGLAVDNQTVADLLALAYDCEDRIKALKRSGSRRPS